ncbi:ABC transporter ATP-binding protein [Lactobacillus sp. CC-MHH1034]|uniref:ABC transporter ATP-binding protein n=1 Tax=Agrilactobacillus fermenti TaxID=2586909 RepID=UPI001E61F45D|nr:ABC transporter ATP-binding protein [Agrilactobacillus fermenti]MCD2255130.1 ABC transporter ATP-binding protein [Agrilactobacillus fermenti]
MLRLLLRAVREYRKESILTPLLVTTEVAIETFIPFLMASIIDKGITPGNVNYIWRMGLLLIVMALASLSAGASSSWFSSHAAAGFAKNLRHDIFSNIQKFSFQNIDHFSSSSLVTRMTTDITNVQNAYQMTIRIAVRAPLLLIFSIMMAFSINAQMAMIYVVVVPILAISLYVIVHFAYPLFKLVFKRYDRLNQVVSENLRGIRVVKTFVREAEEKQKFEAASKDIYTVFSKAQRILSLNAPLMTFMINTTILVISWLGAQMIVGGQMQTGQLVSMFAYTNSVLFSLMMLSNIITQLSQSQASGQRIAEVLSEVPSIVDPKDPVLTVTDGRVAFDNVSFTYSAVHKRPVLQNINLQIPSGALIGVIGETGSGKSTLVQLLPRLYDATSGEVRVGGVPVQQYALAALRDNVAMVLQNNVLFSGTIKENLRWGNEQATDDEIIASAKIAQADEFIQTLPAGYDTHIEQDGSNVSGGQKQRLTIARALLKNPKILIMDDSTSAVDTATEREIREAFRHEMPQMTKILISQRITSISEADQIIVMAHGKIDAIGTHQELMQTNVIYQALNQSQLHHEAQAFDAPSDASPIATDGGDVHE